MAGVNTKFFDIDEIHVLKFCLVRSVKSSTKKCTWNQDLVLDLADRTNH
jgi:hypothetical protein